MRPSPSGRPLTSAAAAADASALAPSTSFAVPAREARLLPRRALSADLLLGFSTPTRTTRLHQGQPPAWPQPGPRREEVLRRGSRHQGVTGAAEPSARPPARQNGAASRARVLQHLRRRRQVQTQVRHLLILSVYRRYSLFSGSSSPPRHLLPSPLNASATLSKPRKPPAVAYPGGDESMGRIGDLRTARLNLLTVSWIRNRVPPGAVRWAEAQQEACCKRPGPAQLLGRADGHTRCWPVACCIHILCVTTASIASTLLHVLCTCLQTGSMEAYSVTTEGMTQDTDEILYEVE